MLRKEYPDRLILFVDNNRIFNYLLEEAERQGMDVSGSCAPITFQGCEDSGAGVDILESEDVTVCPDSGKYFFYDAAHPTSKINLWISAIGCQLLDFFNFDVQCPEVPGFDARKILVRYLREADDLVTSAYRHQLLEGQCPYVEKP